MEFADSPPLIVQFSDLSDFATERGNPNNAKQVTRIHIKLPSPKLTEGIIFVDTPGLGTLATSGSTETLTYLPQCDLGILMLEASVGVTPSSVAKAMAPTKPLFSFTFTVQMAKRRLQEQIRWQVGPDLTDFLRAYTKQLRSWFREAIANLRASFQAAAAIYRVDLEPPERGVN